NAEVAIRAKAGEALRLLAEGVAGAPRLVLVRWTLFGSTGRGWSRSAVRGATPLGRWIVRVGIRLRGLRRLAESSRPVGALAFAEGPARVRRRARDDE